MKEWVRVFRVGREHYGSYLTAADSPALRTGAGKQKTGKILLAFAGNFGSNRDVKKTTEYHTRVPRPRLPALRLPGVCASHPPRYQRSTAPRQEDDAALACFLGVAFIFSKGGENHVSILVSSVTPAR